MISPDDDDLEVDLKTPDGVVWFVKNVLGVRKLAPYQDEILRDFVAHKRIAVRAPHGAGKTALSAWIVLWAICAYRDTDVKVVTTASAWRQLIHFTWPEIKKWAARADFDRAGVTLRRGKEILELNIKAGQREAFAVASDNAAFIEGAHASVVIYVFDEAKAIPAAIWDAAEGAFATAGEDTDSLAFALAISTPGDTSGRFYDICTHKPGYKDWRTRHIKLEEAIAAGRISRQWVEARREQWGENDPRWKNRVLGDFDDTGTNAVIPLAWVEQANERWYAWMEKRDAGELETQPRPEYGVDPAYMGKDKITVAEKIGRVITEVSVEMQQTTMQTAGRVAAMIDYNTPVAIDTIGVGAGVFDRLDELGYEGALGVNVSHKAVDPWGNDLLDISGTRKFFNLRSYIWWMLREALDPDGIAPIALPPIDELTGDLTAPTYSYISDGRVKVESKPDIQERLGRSTDYADAVGLALFASFYQPMQVA